MTQIKEKAVKGVAWTALGTWGNQLTTFIVFILLTRLLEPSDFGLVAMASFFTSFVAIFAEQGMSQAIVQRDKIEESHLDTAFWTNIIIGTSLTVFVVLISGAVAGIYRQPLLRPIIAILSVNFLLTSLNSTQQALLQRNLDFKTLSIRQLISAICGGVVGIVMAFMGAGVYALVGKTLATGLIDVIVLWRVSAWRPRFVYSKQHFRELFSFGISIVGVRITNFLRTRLDDFLIGYFLGSVALGYYTVAYRLGRLTLEMFSGVMSRVAVPSFARLQNDALRWQAALNKFSGMAGLITFPIFAGLIVLAPDLIVALSGDQWLPSAPSMRVLSLAGFTLSLQYFLSYLIVSLGQPNRLFLLNLIITVVTSIAFAISAQYGILYVSFAYVIVNVVFYGIYLVVVYNIFPIDVKKYLVEGWRYILPTFVMGVIVFFVNNYLTSVLFNIYIRVILDVMIGVMAYVIMIYYGYSSSFVEVKQLVFSVMPFARRMPGEMGGTSHGTS